jgi:hypothetical protein
LLTSHQEEEEEEEEEEEAATRTPVQSLRISTIFKPLTIDEVGYVPMAELGAVSNRTNARSWPSLRHGRSTFLGAPQEREYYVR